MRTGRARLDLDAVRVVSWDVDGTLYSLRRMKWFLRVAVAGERLRGRGQRAAQDMAALRSRMARVNTARACGGLLGESLRAECVDPESLSGERRLLTPAIARARARRGVGPLIDHLAGTGRAQVVLSDYVAGYKLEAVGLHKRFAAVYEGVQLGFVKPSPQAFHRIAADFGVAPSSLLHIGDRDDADGAGARAAGCAVWILG